jgi:hypothetical protein
MDAQFSSIDWPHFRAVTYKFSLPQRFFLIKWLNDLLPFQARMHTYGQSSMAGCPHLCGCDSEDHHHLLHFPADACTTLFLQLPTGLDTLCISHKIDPLLRKVLLTLLSPYWGASAHFTLPAEYDALIAFQTTLHPDAVFLGCFSTDWARLQFQYLQLNQLPRDERQAETSIRHVMTHLLELVHTVWLTRNSALHGDDATTQLLSYKRTQLLLEVQDLYDQQDQMLAANRQLFTHPYKYWIAQPTSQLHTFLQRMRTTVKTSILQANNLGTNFRTIDTYFPPVIPPAIFAAILDSPYIPPEPD